MLNSNMWSSKNPANMWSNVILESVQEVAATVSSNMDSTPKASSSVSDNHIYFYSGVSTDRALDLIRTLRDTDASLQNQRRARGFEFTPVTPIVLHIHSGGGDLFAGLGVADAIMELETPVYSVIEGYAASAATIISVVCAKRFIQRHGLTLLHQLSAGPVWGTHEEFEDHMVMQNKSMDHIMDVYLNNTHFTEDRLKALLKHDSWYNAEQSLEYGIVDEIIGPVMKNRFAAAG